MRVLVAIVTNTTYIQAYKTILFYLAFVGTI